MSPFSPPSLPTFFFHFNSAISTCEKLEQEMILFFLSLPRSTLPSYGQSVFHANRWLFSFLLKKVRLIFSIQSAESFRTLHKSCLKLNQTLCFFGFYYKISPIAENIWILDKAREKIYESHRKTA